MAARGLGKGLDALIPSAAAQPKTKEKKEKSYLWDLGQWKDF